MPNLIWLIRDAVIYLKRRLFRNGIRRYGL